MRLAHQKDQKMKALGLALGFGMMTAGCVAKPAQTAPVSAPELATISAVDAVIQAAEAAPDKVEGLFEFEVKAVGFDRGWAFVNSEVDYRDQRCLTIVLNPSLLRRFTETHDIALEQFLRGKTIRVRGAAFRARIDFVTPTGQPSGKYYYQTHLDLAEIADLEIVTDGVSKALR